MAADKKYVLVIVDMQPRFKAARTNHKLIFNIIKEIKKAKSLGNHIVFVSYKGFGRITRDLTNAVFCYPNISLVSKEESDGAEVLIKHLEELGLYDYHLKVCGIETNVCIYATVFSLNLLYDGTIEVLGNCCAALNEQTHYGGLFLIQELDVLISNSPI